VIAKKTVAGGQGSLMGQNPSPARGLADVEEERKRLSGSTQHDRKSEFGQFLTPSRVAEYMTGLFSSLRRMTVRLLDPGAGTGMLTCAFLQRALADRVASLEASCFEIDDLILPRLVQNLHQSDALYFGAGIPLQIDTNAREFIKAAAEMVRNGKTPYTHVIMNPPYRKISSQSEQRKLLHAVGIESVNLYAAFLALSIRLLEKGGEIVAIIPRSFCNGSYYFPLRKLIREDASIEHIHVFDSRRGTFRDEDVLQENVIVHLSKRAQIGDVVISSSHDAAFTDYQERRVEYSEVVGDDDEDYFIHIPTDHTATSRSFPRDADHQLEKLDIQVSTGPVVDFRTTEYIVSASDRPEAPLLYPANICDGKVIWPTVKGKGSRAMKVAPGTEKLLFPAGYYVVVRRFSSKEEARRIVAAVISPGEVSSQYYAFENHLDVFHSHKHGLERDVAYGLMAYLNNAHTDQYFRRFSGHTQVNAGDLRKLHYPSREALACAGREVAESTGPVSIFKNNN